jgi:hypothetical protein
LKTIRFLDEDWRLNLKKKKLTSKNSINLSRDKKKRKERR